MVERREHQHKNSGESESLSLQNMKARAIQRSIAKEAERPTRPENIKAITRELKAKIRTRSNGGSETDSSPTDEEVALAINTQAATPLDEL